MTFDLSEDYKQKSIKKIDRAVSVAAVTQTMATAQTLLIIGIFVLVGFDGCSSVSPGKCYFTVCSYSSFCFSKQRKLNDVSFMELI